MEEHKLEGKEKGEEGRVFGDRGWSEGREGGRREEEQGGGWWWCLCY